MAYPYIGCKVSLLPDNRKGATAIYEEFFGLVEPPFDTKPNPRFAYPSTEHKIAIAKMNYAAERRRGLAVLMGPIGSGKTTIAHHLQRLWSEDEGKSVAFLPYAAVNTRAAFLRLVSEAFSLVPVRNEADSQKIIERFLYEQNAAGKHPVLLLDEGQDVKAVNLDTLSYLSNFQTPESKMITIIILAQDNFPNKLARKDAFRSRIAVLANLDPLSFEDMQHMIDHRLRTAGGTGIEAIFDLQAQADVYDITQGTPRDVCIFCDAALVNAFVRAQKTITPEIVRQTLTEMKITKRWPIKKTHLADAARDAAHQDAASAAEEGGAADG